jgi:hypothetical protein
MRIVDPPVILSPYGAPAGNTSRVAPLRPPQPTSTINAERRTGTGQLPEEHVRVGQLVPPTAIPNDWAAATRFVGGRAGAVYDRFGNAVQMVDLPPAISAYLSHSQTDHTTIKVGNLVNAFV